MICRSCNRNLPARARYCVHCGAEQDPPTPIAFAAAMAGGRREAANAVFAEAAPQGRGEVPPRTTAGLPGDTTRASNERDGPSQREAAAATNDLDSTPAYANAPSRVRLATALLVACLVVGAVGLTAAWWLRPAPPLVASPTNAGTASSAASSPAPSGASNEAATPEAPASATSATSNSTAPPANRASGPADEGVTRENAAESANGTESSSQAAVQITPLPPAHRAATRPRAALEPVPEKPEATSHAEPAPAPAAPSKRRNVAAAPPAATAAAPVADRWTRMNEEMSRCTREDFIARVVCGQRVRFRYCDGYWGKVPACPGSPAAERGQ